MSSSRPMGLGGSTISPTPTTPSTPKSAEPQAPTRAPTGWVPTARERTGSPGPAPTAEPLAGFALGVAEQALPPERLKAVASALNTVLQGREGFTRLSGTRLDEATLRALMAFQRDERLPITGLADAKTVKQLTQAAEARAGFLASAEPLKQAAVPAELVKAFTDAGAQPLRQGDELFEFGSAAALEAELTRRGFKPSLAATELVRSGRASASFTLDVRDPAGKYVGGQTVTFARDAAGKVREVELSSNLGALGQGYLQSRNEHGALTRVKVESWGASLAPELARGAEVSADLLSSLGGAGLKPVSDGGPQFDSTAEALEQAVTGLGFRSAPGRGELSRRHPESQVQVFASEAERDGAFVGGQTLAVSRTEAGRAYEVELESVTRRRAQRYTEDRSPTDGTVKRRSVEQSCR